MLYCFNNCFQFFCDYLGDDHSTQANIKPKQYRETPPIYSVSTYRQRYRSHLLYLTSLSFFVGLFKGERPPKIVGTPKIMEELIDR